MNSRVSILHGCILGAGSALLGYGLHLSGWFSMGLYLILITFALVIGDNKE